MRDPPDALRASRRRSDLVQTQGVPRIVTDWRFCNGGEKRIKKQWLRFASGPRQVCRQRRRRTKALRTHVDSPLRHDRSLLGQTETSTVQGLIEKAPLPARP